MRTLIATLALTALLSADAAGQVVLVVEKIQDLNLTDEQETRIAEIQKQYKPKVQEASKELETLAKEEVDKIREVLTAEQRQKIEALRDEREDRREECVAHIVARLKTFEPTT